MNGRVYAVDRQRRMVAIETQLHGFTIVQLLGSETDVTVGDEVSWESELRVGTDTYNNLSTRRPFNVVAHHHLVSKSMVRQTLMA